MKCSMTGQEKGDIFCVSGRHFFLLATVANG
jgi:hypothetical protein